VRTAHFSGDDVSHRPLFQTGEFMNYKPKAIQKTVTTAGTEVQVSSGVLTVRSCVIQALAANAGKIYVGGSDVDSTHGAHLSPGASLTLEAPGDPTAYIDLTNVYVDAETNGDKVNVLYLERA
jgi:hypothetical protein